MLELVLEFQVVHPGMVLQRGAEFVQIRGGNPRCEGRVQVWPGEAQDGNFADGAKGGHALNARFEVETASFRPE